MSCALPVGIDLGTTFSCVSVYRNGRSEIIPNKDGNRLIPSVVFFDPETGKASVGDDADDLMPLCAGNLILDSKRIIGRKYDDQFISRYTRSKQMLFTLVRARDDQAAFEIEVSGRKVTKMPEEVSAEILKYLKDMASSYLGNLVTEAVISVPAYFSNAQRQATKRAAVMAGLKVLKLVTEPTAAAIHYVSDKKKNNANILVFDFGGGTLDVSLIKINNKVFEVKAVYGDTLLGGRNFDELLFDYFKNDFLEKHGRNIEKKVSIRRLNNGCIKLKKKLSATEEFAIVIPCYDGTDSDYSLSMGRKKFEELSQDIFQRCLDVVQLCLHDAELSKSDIDEIVLVGGSTRIPKIRRMLETFFDGKRVKWDVNPDEAVAAGASVQAALLTSTSEDLEIYSITEVTPLSLGIRVKSDYMSVYIPKNSALPMTRKRIVTTTVNDQIALNFEIYEGERKNTRYNNKLGEFRISDLPLDRAGQITIQVNFELDKDGLLTVRASEESRGISNSLTVTMGQFRLSERRIERTLEEAERNRREDEVFEKFNLARCNYDERCYQILYDINKISSEHDRCVVQECCSDFLEYSKQLYFTKIDALDASFASLMKFIGDILKENKMLELKYLHISNPNIYEECSDNSNCEPAVAIV